MMRYLALAALAAVAKADYPAAYPFDDEDYVPPAIAASSPDHTFEDSDPGGYMYTYSYNYELKAEEFEIVTTAEEPYMGFQYGSGFSWTGHGCFMHSFFHSFDAPPVFPEGTWNCTARAVIYEQEHFPGIIDGKTICTDCCAWEVGKIGFSYDTNQWADWIETKVKTGLCTDLPELIYCVYSNAYTQNNCYEYVPSVDERYIVFPCYDVYTKYWLTCPAFKKVGFHTDWELEPAGYMEPLSIEESSNVHAFFAGMDRHCHPNSYYFESGGGAGGDDDDDDSSVQAFSLMAAIAAAALL